MCTSCGCSHGEARVEGSAIEHDEHHHHHHSHGHHHDDRTHEHGHDHHEHSHVHASESADIHFGQGPARTHAPGISQKRMVQIEQSILSKNDQYAAQNRNRFATKNILALNLVSSPGSGKTTLMTTPLNALKNKLSLGVIE